MSIERDQRGLSTVEVLAATTLLAITLLSIATMFLTAHTQLDRSGESTVAVSLVRQLFEDARSMSFGDLDKLDGLDTASAGSLTADEPARGIARRWRYALAGENASWPLSTTERQRWSSFAPSGTEPTAQVQVAVTTPSTRTVTVTVNHPGSPHEVRLSTIISRTVP